MKRAIACVILAVFLLSVTSSTASAALMGSWVPSVSTVVGTRNTARVVQEIIYDVAQLNADTVKFEGLLGAYSSSGDPIVEEQVLLTSENITTSMQILNEELKAIYSDLSEDEQSDIVSAYSSMGLYLVDLADEANQIFQEGGKSTADFDVEEWGPIAGELPGQIWTGSLSAI